jgi:hypothetical protein
VTPTVDVSSVSPVAALPAWPAHTRRTDALDDLVAIYEPGLTLVTAPLEVAPAERALLVAAAREVPCFEFVKETSPEGESLEHALPWFEGHAGGEAWLAVARPLVRLFADLFEAERLGVRLTLANKPMCPRFHVDDVVCRLVVTLEGAASEFLGDVDVRRKLLGAKESAVERDGAPVHQLAPLEVGLFKGEAWPDNRGHGIVHRSPAGAERRLVMTVDLL